MHGDSLSRRAFVGSAATAAVAGLAGCSAGGRDGTAESSDGSGPSDESTESPDDSEPSEESASAGNFGEWFGATTNYDGVVEKTDESNVEVTVGSQANGGAYGFSPAAIRVSPGTTVVWTWTGEGGVHDVVSTDDSFASERVRAEGHTFSHTFEEAGTYEYFCTPHRAMGMKGAVVVE